MIAWSWYSRGWSPRCSATSFCLHFRKLANETPPPEELHRSATDHFSKRPRSWDPSGIGETAPKWSSYSDSWFGQEKVTWLALMVGKPLVGLRMDDIIRGADLIRWRNAGTWPAPATAVRRRTGHAVSCARGPPCVTPQFEPSVTCANSWPSTNWYIMRIVEPTSSPAGLAPDASRSSRPPATSCMGEASKARDTVRIA
jgi:hypothetical protein